MGLGGEVRTVLLADGSETAGPLRCPSPLLRFLEPRLTCRLPANPGSPWPTCLWSSRAFPSQRRRKLHTTRRPVSPLTSAALSVKDHGHWLPLAPSFRVWPSPTSAPGLPECSFCGTGVNPFLDPDGDVLMGVSLPCYSGSGGLGARGPFCNRSWCQR